MFGKEPTPKQHENVEQHRSLEARVNECARKVGEYGLILCGVTVLFAGLGPSQLDLAHDHHAGAIDFGADMSIVEMAELGANIVNNDLDLYAEEASKRMAPHGPADLNSFPKGGNKDTVSVDLIGGVPSQAISADLSATTK